MKAEKVVVTIKVELLHIDALAGTVGRAVSQVDDGMECGHLAADDGDTVSWETTRTPVEF